MIRIRKKPFLKLLINITFPMPLWLEVLEMEFMIIWRAIQKT